MRKQYVTELIQNGAHDHITALDAQHESTCAVSTAMDEVAEAALTAKACAKSVVLRNLASSS